MTDDVFIQLSIFVNNEPGSLASMAKTLKECDINLKAFNIAESSGFGVFRAIVDDPEEAYEKLKARNLIVRKTELIAVAVNDAPGGLFSAAKVLGDAGINIEYGYAHKNKTEPLIFLRVDDPVAAVEAFKKAGMKTVTAKEL
ncbi:MAG: amino acid-binding protein [Candidatus Methanomethylophilaceae archaeon]|nr:amino acid-binding protein [Candidatus Methanomethylophilaceae archaeon]